MGAEIGMGEVWRRLVKGVLLVGMALVLLACGGGGGDAGSGDPGRADTPADDGRPYVELGDWPLGRVSRVMLPVPETPLDSLREFGFGPDSHGNRYAPRRSYFLVEFDGRPAVVWQAPGGGVVRFTALAEDLTVERQLELPSGGDTLTAATVGDGVLFYLTQELAPRENRAARLTLHGVNLSEGVQSHRSRTLDTGPQELNMIVSQTNSAGLAAMVYGDRRLGVMMSRLMHTGADGFNHQGGIALMFDAQTLSPVRNLGQTSGHSFDNVLYYRGGGAFFGADLGDNYPRGVHLVRFDHAAKRSRVVFTFKTLHGNQPGPGPGITYPPYPELGMSGGPYYKWSNDNNTYSELGGVVADSAGYAVFFVGEPDADGRALDNARARNFLHDARNIGLVKVREAFDALRGHPPSVVSDDILLSIGPGTVVETGGFYTFNGTWAPQRNNGVRWLTMERDPNVGNVSRLKALQIGADRVLLLWERWTRTSYLDTRYMVVDSLGNAILPETSLGLGVRLHRSNQPLVIGNRVFLVDGAPQHRALRLTVIEIGVG